MEEMIGQCKQCGFQAGIFGLTDGLCKHCLDGVAGNVEKRISKMQGKVCPECSFSNVIGAVCCGSCGADISNTPATALEEIDYLNKTGQFNKSSSRKDVEEINESKTNDNRNGISCADKEITNTEDKNAIKWDVVFISAFLGLVLLGLSIQFPLVALLAIPIIALWLMLGRNLFGLAWGAFIGAGVGAIIADILEFDLELNMLVGAVLGAYFFTKNDGG